MEDNKQQYLSLLSEIIAKEMMILGPDMAILTAQSIDGLVVDKNGVVTDIVGYEADAVKKMIDEYQKISGVAADEVINSIFEKYPQIKRIT